MTDNKLTKDYQLSDSQKDELDKRLSDHQNSIGRTFTWDETVAIAEMALLKKQLNNQISK